MYSKIKRMYCGGNKKKEIPLVDDFMPKGIFSNVEHRNQLLNYWKKEKVPFKNPGKEEEIKEMGNKHKNILQQNNKVEKVVVKEKKKVVEEVKEVKELPVIGQFLLQKLVEKNVGKIKNK